MGLPGKHQFGKLNKDDDQVVTFVEKKVTRARMEFLKELLEHNGFEVIVQEIPGKTEEDPTLYTVAVTDLVFNPTTYIFQRRLKTPDGRKVTQDYWFQRTTETPPQYFEQRKKRQ